MTRLSLRADQQQRTLAALKADTDLSNLLAATPQQIDAWIDANVTSLAEARRVLRLLAKLSLALWRQG